MTDANPPIPNPSPDPPPDPTSDPTLGQPHGESPSPSSADAARPDTANLEAQLLAYIEGETSPAEARAVEAALQRDPATWNLARQVRADRDALRSVEPEAPPIDLVNEAIAQLERDALVAEPLAAETLRPNARHEAGAEPSRRSVAARIGFLSAAAAGLAVVGGLIFTSLSDRPISQLAHDVQDASPEASPTFARRQELPDAGAPSALDPAVAPERTALDRFTAEPLADEAIAAEAMDDRPNSFAELRAELRAAPPALADALNANEEINAGIAEGDAQPVGELALLDGVADRPRPARTFAARSASRNPSIPTASAIRLAVFDPGGAPAPAPLRVNVLTEDPRATAASLDRFHDNRAVALRGFARATTADAARTRLAFTTPAATPSATPAQQPTASLLSDRRQSGGASSSPTPVPGRTAEGLSTIAVTESASANQAMQRRDLADESVEFERANEGAARDAMTPAAPATVRPSGPFEPAATPPPTPTPQVFVLHLQPDEVPALVDHLNRDLPVTQRAALEPGMLGTNRQNFAQVLGQPPHDLPGSAGQAPTASNRASEASRIARENRNRFAATLDPQSTDAAEARFGETQTGEALLGIQAGEERDIDGAVYRHFFSDSDRLARSAQPPAVFWYDRSPAGVEVRVELLAAPPDRGGFRTLPVPLGDATSEPSQRPRTTADPNGAASQPERSDSP
ncbi:MAG: hypothetical protein AAF288_02200 [Planctomycetota bacterium]